MKSIKLIIAMVLLMMASNVLFSQELHKVPVASKETKKFNEHISKVNVQCTDSRVYIKWNFASDDADGVYTIERSLDGKKFIAIGNNFMGNKAIGNPKDKFLSFTWIDFSPITGLSYYRFAKVEKDNNIVLSDGYPVVCPATSFVNLSSEK